MEKKYKLIKNYSMKCRLYPNNAQKTQIDNILYGKAVAYNMILYKFKQYMFTTVDEDKVNPGSFVHFPNFKEAINKVNLEELRHEHEFISYVPAYGLSGNSGVIGDINRAFEKTGKHPIEQWDWEKKLPDGTIQHFGPQFHSKYDNHLSFSYQPYMVDFITTDNRNVIKLKRIKSNNYCVDGPIKIKGWNQGLRFDENLQSDFLDWLCVAKSIKGKRITVRIERDLDRYYIIFSLHNVYRPYSVNEERNDHVGIDVGEISLAVLSDEKVYKNIFDQNSKYQKTIDTINHLKTVKSRRWGYSNKEFIKERNKQRKERKKAEENKNDVEIEENKEIESSNKREGDIKPSKRYMRTQKRMHRLYSRRNDIQENYYNTVSADIISNNEKINVETLRVSDMFWWKEKKSNEEEEKRKDKKADTDTQQKSV